LRGLDSALVAFSGGVDSSLLLALAIEALGDRAVAFTALSPAVAPDEMEGARAVARALGARHVEKTSAELEDPRYAANPVNRCYFCKDNLFVICAEEARRRGLAVVLDGANLDDLGDHRPGLAAAAEQGVRHPLVEAGLTKDDIRAGSRAAGLVTWDRPASPCLSSRFPYGTTITHESLVRVAAAERVLRSLGLRDLRVRHHDTLARIEVPVDAMPLLLETGVRERVTSELRRLGYAWVTLDLVGFRSGSLNEVLQPKYKGPEG
jgi:uncharacterized protein